MGQNEGYGLGKHLLALQLCTFMTYLGSRGVRMNGTPDHVPLLHHVAPNSNKPRQKKNKNQISKFSFSINCSTTIVYVF